MNRRMFLNSTIGLAATGFALRADTDAGATPIVATTNGRLRGRIADGLHIFKGVPYGAPTGGSNRFMPPQPPESWTGVRDAFEYGHHAPQSHRQRGVKQLEYFGILRAPSTVTPSEDCLYLNVWTKSVNDGAKRPVMAWTHGGAHDPGTGASLAYDGAGVPKHPDAAAVTLSHPLNIPG